MSSILDFKSLKDTRATNSRVSLCQVPSFEETDIVNLMSDDVTVLSVDGKKLTTIPASGYTISLRSTLSITRIDKVTEVAIFTDGLPEIKYYYKGCPLTFDQLPEADYYLVDNNTFSQVTRGQFCTNILPVVQGDKECFAAILFKAAFKPAILQITDHGVLQVRLESEPLNVIGSFNYNYLGKNHIGSKLKRLKSAFIRQQIYVKMVVCDPEVAKHLDLYPDQKVDLERALESSLGVGRISESKKE